MSQTSIVYLGRIIYLNSIDIHEQINTRTDKCELHSGHFYHNRMLPTIYRFVTWADQKEWKWSNDHCFHFSIDFHSFFFFPYEVLIACSFHLQCSSTLVLVLLIFLDISRGITNNCYSVVPRMFSLEDTSKSWKGTERPFLPSALCC